MKKYTGVKPRKVEVREEKPYKGIGKKFSILYDDVKQATVETTIGNHSDEEVEGNVKLFANSYNTILELKKLALLVEAGHVVTFKELEEIIDKSM